MKIKQKTRNIVMMALLSVALLGCVVVVIWKLIPEGKKFSAFSYDYSTPMEEFGDGITIDGKLDETLWKDQRMFEADIKDTNVTYQMTSYYGKSGVYFAFDVQDDAVYYNEGRAIYANSGVEFCVGNPDNTEITYEIDLNAGGNAMLRKYNGKRYNDWYSDLNSAVWVNGEINTSDCKGYTIELYLPYSLFNEDNQDIPLDDLVVNPGIVRASSADPLSTDRLWYSIGFEERGLDWMPASPNWYHFNKDGLVAYDVTIQNVDNGKIIGKSYAVHGDDYTVEVVPSKGYYATYVLINDENVTEDLYYLNGKTYCTVEGAKEDLKIKAVFAKIPSKTLNVFGKINDGKTSVSSAKVWAIKNGYVQTITMDSKGNYLEKVPAIEGLGILVEAEGYVSKYITVKDGKNNIVLRKEYLGDNENVQRSSSNKKLWDLTRLYEERVRLKSSAFGMKLVNSEIYSNSVYASANVITNAEKGVDTRAGFTFYQDKDTSVIIALTMSGEINDKNPEGKIFCDVQLILEKKGEFVWRSGGITVPFENQQEIIKVATSKAGIPMAVHYCNGMFDVWVNGQQVGFCIYPADENGQNILNAKAKMAVGLECWATKAVYEDLKFDGNYPVRTANSIPGWDLSELNKGIAKSLTDSEWTQAMLTNEYSNKTSISADIPLPQIKGKDIRAGFYFKNKSGEDAFVALTANGEVNANNPEGKLFYSIQMISKGYKSWSHSGVMEDISKWDHVATKAMSDAGVPMTVYVENGKFTIGIDGYMVAKDIYPTDEKGASVFGEDTSFIAGLATAGKKTSFTNVKVDSEKPSLNKKADAGWDLSKLDQGEVVFTEKKDGAFVMLWNKSRERYYITSNIVLAPTGEDVREGYRFEDKDGNAIFVCLLCEADGRYMVQIVNKPIDGEWEWIWASPYIGEEYSISKAADAGVVFDVAYDKGVLNMWINNRKIGTDIELPLKPEASLGLECWNTVGKYYQLEVFDNWH